MADAADLSRLDKVARDRLLDELQTEEVVEVVVAGRSDSGIVATSSRVIVIKRDQIHSWPLEAVSHAESSIGFVFSWAALRGADLPATKPDAKTVDDLPNAIHLKDPDQKPIKRLTSFLNKAASLPRDLWVEYREADAAGRDQRRPAVPSEALEELFTLIAARPAVMVRRYHSVPAIQPPDRQFAAEAEILGEHGYIPTSQAFIPNNALTGISVGAGALVVSYARIGRISRMSDSRG